MTKLIQRYSDLVTSRQEICRGFLAQAKEKTVRAKPFVQEARELWKDLLEAKTLEQVLETVPINKLSTAMGFSEKARSKFSSSELRTLTHDVIKSTLKGIGDKFREEILYRYLLTRGDALGGKMRNVTGSSAQIIFTGAIITFLNIKRKKLKIATSPKEGAKIKSIEWEDRIILFDRKPQFIDKNIDVILLKKPDHADDEKLIHTPSLYIACGELKGGIDPAGADEHWKTARSALERIRYKFKESCPKLFFAANAIEEAMAKEIFEMLEKGELSYAANVNYKAQLESLVSWLISL